MLSTPTLEASSMSKPNTQGKFSRTEFIVLRQAPKAVFPVRNVFKQEAANAIAFANITSKIRYDLAHKRINLRVGDEAYLQLHHAYRLPRIYKKLGLQLVGTIQSA
ncbi:MAG: hypothetical protein MMC33_006435 [Icmadophila ericetorum]|nr:hypothetical protein [Icmadophila ericetorum]